MDVVEWFFLHVHVDFLHLHNFPKFGHNEKTKISFVYNSYCKNFEIHYEFYKQCKNFETHCGLRVVHPQVKKISKNKLRIVQPAMCFKIFYIIGCRTHNAFFQIFTLRVVQPAMHLKKIHLLICFWNINFFNFLFFNR